MGAHLLWPGIAAPMSALGNTLSKLAGNEMPLYGEVSTGHRASVGPVYQQ